MRTLESVEPYRAEAGGSNGKSKNRRSGKTVQAADRYVKIPDLQADEKTGPLPEKYEGTVMRKKKGFFNFAHKYVGSLSAGILKLRRDAERKQKSNKLQSEYVIELDKVAVLSNDKKRLFQLAFRNETHQITPVNKNTYDSWKTALTNHRRYRQGRIRDGVDATSDIALLQPTVSPVLPPASSQLKSVATLEENNNAKSDDLLVQQMRDVQSKIQTMLGDVEKIHSDVENLLSGQDNDNDNASSMSADDEEADDEDENESVAKPTDLLPKNSHKSLKATRSKIIADTKQTNEGCNGSSFVQALAILQDTLTKLTKMKQLYDEIKVKMEDTTTEESSTPEENRRKTSIDPEKIKLPDIAFVTKKKPETTKEAKATKETTSVSKSVEKEESKSVSKTVEKEETKRPTKKKEKSIAEEVKPIKILPPPALPTPTPPAVSPVVSALSPNQAPSRRRTVLPANQIELASIPYSAVIRAKLPIWAYEPVGTLQVLCEELRFSSSLLDKAIAASPSIRMCYVAAFAMSSYSSYFTRKQKPFNPIRGETFDYVSEDGWKYHSEQISHHPPVSAAHATHKEWEWSACVKADAKITFQGSAELVYKLPTVLKLPELGEVYNYNKVKTIIQNPLKAADKRIIRNEGTMKILCSNQLECRLLFSNNSDNTVSGGVFEGKKLIHKLSGSWDKGLSRITDDGKFEKLFEVPSTPKQILDKFYGFTPFTITLNELHTDELNQLAVTDSRLRPDQRLMEEGNAKDAAEAKAEMEKNQRRREANGQQPLWFEPSNRQDYWRTNGKYFAARGSNFKDSYSRRMPKDLFKI